MKFIYETDRLILKLLGEDDAPAVLQFYKQNQNVFEPYETIHPEQFYTVAYQRTLMNCELNLTLKHSLIRFYIFRRENPDEIIGTVCFRNINRSTYYSCETGYRFSPAYWHRGYAREALAFGIQLMFEEFHLHRLIGRPRRGQDTDRDAQVVHFNVAPLAHENASFKLCI